MKKVLLLLLLVFSSFSLFAIEDVATNVRVWGYYEAQTGASLTIVDYNNVQLYESYTQASDSEHLNKNDAQPIFTWNLTGTFGNNCTVTLTFTPLQAYVNGRYYRPAYSIVAEKPTSTKNGDISNNTYTFTGSGLTDSNNRAGGTKTYSSYEDSTQQFSDTFSYSFKFTQRQTSPVTRSGVFKMHISGYNNTVSGTFNYRCNVNIEFTTN